MNIAKYSGSVFVWIFCSFLVSALSLICSSFAVVFGMNLKIYIINCIIFNVGFK